MAQRGSKPHACAKCGRNHHSGYTFYARVSKNKQRNGNGGNRAQSSLVAPPDRVAPRGATYVYAFGKRVRVLREEKKEEKGEERSRFVKIVEFDLWISLGVIPT
ncbi:hypothetical protein H5410_047549, partial [Solanum commersonii]